MHELFGLAAAAVPLLMLRTMALSGLSAEETLLATAGIYALIRYGLANIFRHMTVHRGMFHSIPAMFVAGLIAFLAYRHPVMELRAYLAIGVMVGFLSHLVLDELCAVDFRGLDTEVESVRRVGREVAVRFAAGQYRLLRATLLAWIHRIQPVPGAPCRGNTDGAGTAALPGAATGTPAIPLAAGHPTDGPDRGIADRVTFVRRNPSKSFRTPFLFAPRGQSENP